jgi:hypothetical protein
VALAVAIGAIVLVVFQLTGGVTRAGDRFLTLVREGRTHDAYLATAKAFRTATPEEGFVSYLRTSGLADNESARWSSRSLSGATGELEGSVRTRDGGTAPLKLKLVKEENEWRVLAVERVAAGVLAGAATPATGAPVIPPEAELSRMDHADAGGLPPAVPPGGLAVAPGRHRGEHQGGVRPRTCASRPRRTRRH